MAVAPRGVGDLITLNLGGTPFTCRRSTLTNCPGSMLAAMFGHPFIDRNPKHFASILDFLRCGTVALPSSPVERQELRQEADYYGLEGLLAELDDAEAQCTHRQALQDRQLEATAAVAAARAEVLREAQQAEQAAAAAGAAAEQELAEARAQQAAAVQRRQAVTLRLRQGGLPAAEAEEARNELAGLELRTATLHLQANAALRAYQVAGREGCEARTLKLAALGIALPPPPQQPPQQPQQQPAGPPPPLRPLVGAGGPQGLPHRVLDDELRWLVPYAWGEERQLQEEAVALLPPQLRAPRQAEQQLAVARQRGGQGPMQADEAHVDQADLDMFEEVLRGL